MGGFCLRRCLARAQGSVARGGPVLLPGFLLGLFVGTSAEASAQLLQVPPPSEWSNSSKFSFIQTGGNTESITFGLANELVMEWENTETQLDMIALRTRTTRFTRSAVGTADDFRFEEETETRDSAEHYHFSFRSDRGFSERSTVFGQVGWTRNTFTGINARYVVVGGMSTRWVESEMHQLRSSYGPTFNAQDDVVPDPDVASIFVGVQVSGEYELQLTDNTEFKSTLVVNENGFHLADLRADWVTTLGVSMNDRFGLQAEFRYHFDNHPSLTDVPLTSGQGEPAGEVSVPLGKTDRVLTMALVVDF